MFAYEMILLRELDQNAMVWQTPALSLTAQAFLLTIALSEEADTWAQAAASTLGVIVALLSVQLMAKHVYLAELDRAQLQVLEQRLGLPHIAQRQWDSGVVVPKRGRLQAMRSHRLWMGGLWIFAAVNVAVLGVRLATVVGKWLT